MRCQRAQIRLMAYHDSELSAGAGRRLEKHLESCDDCRQLLENLRRADHHASQSDGINPVVGVPDMPPPDDKYWASFTARVLDRVEEDAATRAPDRKKTRRNWDLFIPRMVPAFSVALVVVVAAGVLLKMGGPTPVMKAPIPAAESVRDNEVREKEALPVMAEIVETESKADTGLEETRRAALEKSVEAVETFRPAPSELSAPLPAPEPETPPAPESVSTDVPVKTAQAKAAQEKPVPQPVEIISQSKAFEGNDNLEKKTALAAPTAAAKGEEVEKAVVPEPLEEIVSKVIESDPVSPPVVAETDADIPPEVVGKTAASGQITRDLPDETSSAAAGMERSFAEPAAKDEETAVKDDRKQEVAAAGPAPVPTAPTPDPVIPGYTAGTDLGNEMEVADIMVPSMTGRSRSPVPDVLEPPLEEPQLLADTEVPDDIPEFSDKSTAAVSRMETLESPAPPRETRQSFRSSLPYRGPEDQLTHAKRLAEVRKFWESEQVLKDLISQKPPVPIQEEASILLVRVLSSQNRVGEAQKTLDDAKIQFPSNDMIQTFELNPEGERPAQ